MSLFRKARRRTIDTPPGLQILRPLRPFVAIHSASLARIRRGRIAAILSGTPEPPDQNVIVATTENGSNPGPMAYRVGLSKSEMAASTMPSMTAYTWSSAMPQ
jgi:hypothetical protein